MDTQNPGLAPERFASVDVLVPFTYSSAIEADTIRPSRLSLMAFDAARYIADMGGAPLVVAGEQSYSTVAIGTGEALRQEAEDRGIDMSGYDLTLIPPGEDRLINTPKQVAAIEGWLKETGQSDAAVGVVCWGFHAQRIVRDFAKRGAEVAIIRVEDVIDHLWEQPEYAEQFCERYGFEVAWPEVKQRALPDFERREKLTRLASRVGNGAVINFVSWLRKHGRYDDIAPDGQSIREQTH